MTLRLGWCQVASGAANDADPYDDISKDIDIVAGLIWPSPSVPLASPYQGSTSLHVEVGNLNDALGPYATGPQAMWWCWRSMLGGQSRRGAPARLSGWVLRRSSLREQAPELPGDHTGVLADAGGQGEGELSRCPAPE